MLTQFVGIVDPQRHLQGELVGLLRRLAAQRFAVQIVGGPTGAALAEIQFRQPRYAILQHPQRSPDDLVPFCNESR